MFRVQSQSGQFSYSLLNSEFDSKSTSGPSLTPILISNVSAELQFPEHF
jgi:hypothetical protein